MKENRTSRLVIIILLTLFAAYAVHDPGKYRLGPDLSGGTILIYNAGGQGEKSSIDVEKLLPALKERLDPAGLFNYVIRPLDNNRIEIVMPRAITEDVERVKRLISTVGQLQFKIVANRKKHLDLIERAEINWPNKLVGKEGVFVRYGKWTPVDITSPDGKLLAEQAEKSWPKDPEGGVARFKTSEQLDAVDVNPNLNLVKTAPDGRKFVLATWSDDKVGVDNNQNLVKVDEEGNHWALMFNDPYDVTGRFLDRVGATQEGGGPAVAFTFNAEGASRFLELTTEYQPDPDGYRSQLGVILDNRLRSAPNLNDRISANGVITGNFTSEQVNELVRILDAGQLPVALDKEPSSQFQIGATLGADTIRQGTISIGLSLFAVIIAMGIYYRFAGFVAIVGLSLNLLFTVALMVLMKATWTLPGLAGLVLTIGMAVDSNVLIYERLREELDRGASLGMAIRAGYEKAFSTILDSNLTTISTAIILFLIGTDQVKGFAITLILGILTSMFCALYITRTIFDVFYQKRWLNSLSMMRLMTKTNIDFLKYRNVCYAGSLIVIAIGMVFLIGRGSANFDVDFTGGTMVGMQLTKPLDSATVRRLASEVLPDVSVEEVELADAEPGTHFVVRTTERDTPEEMQGKDLAESVKGKIAKSFKDYLSIPTAEAGQPATILADPSDASFAPFVGGQVVTLTFTQGHSSAFVRGIVDEVLKQIAPNVSDTNNLYALVPISDGSAVEGLATQELKYTQFKLGTNQDVNVVVKAFLDRLAVSPDFEQFSQFGPQVASETQARAIWAIVLSWVAIIIYVWFRFGSWAFGIAGVAALVHDVLMSLGIVAMVSTLASVVPGLQAFYITDMKINLNTVAAILTLIGYSINDTIVIFDRIREVRGKTPRLSAELINRSLNETLSRTIITSALTFLVVVILFFGAGVELRGFAFFLVVGIITGSYSTVFIATPLLLTMSDYQARRKQGAKSQSREEAASTAPSF
ncbi:MAG: protein translocase subunit SecD [Planctomycetota bacterium]